MLDRPPPKRDIQQAVTILRFEVAELEKTATVNLERAAAADQEVVGEYVRHATRLERQAKRLEAVARWLEEQIGVGREAAPTKAPELARQMA